VITGMDESIVNPNDRMSKSAEWIYSSIYSIEMIVGSMDKIELTNCCVSPAIQRGRVVRVVNGEVWFTGLDANELRNDGTLLIYKGNQYIVRIINLKLDGNLISGYVDDESWNTRGEKHIPIGSMAQNRLF